MEELFNKLKELMLLGDIGGDELVSRYRTFAATDEEKALEGLKRRIADDEKNPLPFRGGKLVRYAAASAAVLLLLSSLLILFRKPGSEKPSLSQDAKMAMEQSGRSGKQEAGLKVLTEEAVAEAVKTNAAKAEDFASARCIETEKTKEYWVTLDDGSVIHLNNDTYLIYPERTGSKTREVILDGEAYFVIAKNPGRPFVVHTRQGFITVYGTEFNVSTREPGDVAEVVLVEGSLSVTPNCGDERRIEPGQMATIGEGITVESVDVERYVAWNTGRFSFKDWPLGKVLDIICRWYGVNVIYDDESLSQPHISGNFDRYEDLSTTIESLSTVTGLHFDLMEDTLRISRP